MKDLAVLDRRREIALLVAQQGRITVTEIRARFGVSGVTARSDLDALATAGSLVRSHGGAVRTQAANHADAHHPQSRPMAEVTEEQTCLAQAALPLIRPLDTVMLCPGPVTKALAGLIRDQFEQSLTIITYSLQIASLLGESPQVSLVMLGGLHRYPSGSFVGPHAEQMMKSLHASHCFLNTPGVSVQSGITTADIMEAPLTQSMLEAADQVTVLAERRSVGHRSLVRVAEIEKVHRIICSAGIAEADLRSLRDRHIEVVTV